MELQSVALLGDEPRERASERRPRSSAIPLLLPPLPPHRCEGGAWRGEEEGEE